jgi:(p)ppGpp synthase/HD superfamily hydrolase
MRWVAGTSLQTPRGTLSAVISDIAAQVAKMRLNIGNFKSARTGVEERTIVSFDVEVADLFALARLMRRLERVPGVLAVNRV